MSLDAMPRPGGFVPLHATSGEAASVAEGYASGYSAGWSAGTRAGLKEVEEQRRRLAAEAAERAEQAAAAAQAALATLARAAAAAQARLTPVVADAHTELTAAAVALAETLLGAELRDDETAARAALRRALSVQDEDVVRIRLHPDDLAHLTRTLADLPAELTVPDGVELVADPALDRGDALSELAEGYLDARLSTAVARVKDALEVEA